MPRECARDAARRGNFRQTPAVFHAIDPSFSGSGAPGLHAAQNVSTHARFEAGYRQNSREAILAPSAMAAIFAHTTCGSTAAWPTQVPYPQSLPAITFSRPTSFA